VSDVRTKLKIKRRVKSEFPEPAINYVMRRRSFGRIFHLLACNLASEEALHSHDDAPRDHLLCAHKAAVLKDGELLPSSSWQAFCGLDHGSLRKAPERAGRPF
jgi:hypothetical protein